jgi:quinol monooxygenase YgiN
MIRKGVVTLFALVVRFDCRDAAAAARFDELTAEAVRLIGEREPGTLVYATAAVEGEPLARVFYEVYRDRDAFRAHEEAEHVRQFHARKDPLLAGTRVEFLTPGPGKGPDPS